MPPAREPAGTAGGSLRDQVAAQRADSRLLRLEAAHLERRYRELRDGWAVRLVLAASPRTRRAAVAEIARDRPPTTSVATSGGSAADDELGRVLAAERVGTDQLRRLATSRTAAVETLEANPVVRMASRVDQMVGGLSDRGPRRRTGQPRRAIAGGAPRGHGPLRITITTATPSLRAAPRWGDWHLAQALARAVRRRGHLVDVRTADADSRHAASGDLDVVLRGVTPFEPTPGRQQVLWVISHPEELDLGECDRADLVLVASERFAGELRLQTATPVEVLLQATDHRRFRPVPPDPRALHTIGVVANARNELRPVVADALAADIRPTIFGAGWTPFVDPALVAATHVTNDALPATYSGFDLLLNDHWATMRAWGFVSNRPFDALACGTPVVSDHLAEVVDLFEGSVPTYSTPGDLREIVGRITAEPAAARAQADRGRRLVLAGHTFDHRAATLLDALERHGLTADGAD